MTTEVRSTVLASIDHAPDDVALPIKYVNKQSETYHTIKTANGAVSKTVEQLAKQLAAESTDESVISLRAKIEKAQKDLEARFTKLATEMKASQGEPDKLAEAAAKKKLDSFVTFLDTALADNALTRDDIVGLLSHPLPVKGQTSTNPSPNGDAEKLAAIRQWGRDHGHTVGEKGRLSATLLTEYAKAHDEQAY